MEIRLRPLHLMIESELGDQQYLIVILNDAGSPALTLLIRPQSSLEELGNQTVDVQDIVIMRNSTEHHQSLIYL